MRLLADAGCEHTSKMRSNCKIQQGDLLCDGFAVRWQSKYRRQNIAINMVHAFRESGKSAEKIYRNRIHLREMLLFSIAFS